jgi:hypothetical protein
MFEKLDSKDLKVELRARVDDEQVYEGIIIKLNNLRDDQNRDLKARLAKILRRGGFVVGFSKPKRINFPK